jgi:cell division protein FtsN
MSAERKKLLWISISACVFVLIVLAVGFFLLTPKKNGTQAPAAVGNSAPPKAQDPQDFLSAPPPAAALTPPHNPDGNVIIVYGDKPSIAAPTTAAPPADLSPAAAIPSVAAPAKTAATTVASAPVNAPTAKKPVQKPTTVKVNEYWIQAASFTSRAKADELKQGLAEKGVAALISVKDIASTSWYRIRIGPYSVKADADGWLARLKDIPGCSEAYVSKMIATKNKQ